MAKTKPILDDLPLGPDEIEVEESFRSPVIYDEELAITCDENGNEFRNWVRPNYKDMSVENGHASDWNLTEMLKAGIKPNGIIHTDSAGSRIDNYSALGDFVKAADDILTPVDNENEDTNN